MMELMVVIGIALLVAAAFLVTACRRRRMEADERRDARLFDDVRVEIAGGRLPEARDCVRAARGPLARVLVAVLKFPYGVHERALELARRDGLAAERRPGRGASRILPVLAGLCAALGVASRFGLGSREASAIPPEWLGVSGAGAILLLRSLDARRSRAAARRLESKSEDLARRIVATSGSGVLIAPTSGEADERSAIEVGVSLPS